MPGVGVGGLISNLVNPGLDDQIGAAVTPNPNPLAQQGQPPAATSGSPNMPNAAATKQDPVSANLASLLLKRQRQAELAADFNQNIQGVAAGFGTAQQQASKQAALHGGGGGAGGGIGDVGDIMKIQQQVTDQNEHARFMANASVFAQTLRDHGINVTDPQATELMNNPKFMDSVSGAFGSNVTQTGTVKDADAATAAWAAANPKATPQQIADYKSNLIAGGMGGNDLEQRQYLGERQAALTAGQKDFPDFATWKSQKGAEATTLKTHAEDVTQSKDAAVLDYPGIDQNLTRSQDAIKKLLANMPATIKAIQTPEFMKTGLWAANAPSLLTASDDVKAQAALLEQLNNALAGEGLKNVKNVRNVKEFTALAGALSAGLRPGNTSAGIQSTLEGLQEKFAGTRAIAREQAGLPPEETSSEAPQTAVDHLKAHPELAPAFDAKYGAGSSKKILGQ